VWAARSVAAAFGVGRWVSEEKLDVRPSLVTLRLVASGARKPTAEDEQAAVELDPLDTLAAAGITDSCTLLAYVAKSAACQCFVLYSLHTGWLTPSLTQARRCLPRPWLHASSPCVRRLLLCRRCGSTRQHWRRLSTQSWLSRAM
jgi:hypothetical protein